MAEQNGDAEFYSAPLRAMLQSSGILELPLVPPREAQAASATAAKVDFEEGSRAGSGPPSLEGDVDPRVRYHARRLVDAAWNGREMDVALVLSDANQEGHQVFLGVLQQPAPVPAFLLYQDIQGKDDPQRTEQNNSTDTPDAFIDVSALQAASAVGDLGTVETLLVEARSIDLDYTGAAKSPALHLALNGGHLAVAHALLEAGADPLAPDREGRSALHVLMTNVDHPAAPRDVLQQTISLIRLIISIAGEEGVNHRDVRGWTALHALATLPAGALPVAEAMLEGGAEVNAACQLGGTAASYSIDAGNLPLFRLLLERGASVWSQDAEGMTVLSLAASQPAFAVAVLERPAALRCMAALVELGHRLGRNAALFPALGEEFRQLERRAQLLARELLDGADPAQAYYILQAPPAQEQVQLPWAQRSALSAAVAVGAKPLLASSLTQTQLERLWQGLVYWPDSDTWAPNNRNRRLGLGWFWDSPKLQFWTSLVLYGLYLAVFLEIVLWRGLEVGDRWRADEACLYFYVAGFAVKEAHSLWRLQWEYFASYWNLVDGLVSCLHLAVFAIRVAQPRHESAQELVYLILGANVLASVFRCLVVFTVSPVFGPLQLLLNAMVSDILTFAGIAVVQIFAFAFSLFALYHNNAEYSGPLRTLTGTTKFLFWAILGEFDLDALELDRRISTVFAQFIFGIYMILTVVVAVNLLVALMSTTYSRISDNMDVEWKSQWAATVITSTQETSAWERPPPLNLLLLPNHLLRRAKKKAIDVQGLEAVLPFGAAEPGTEGKEARAGGEGGPSRRWRWHAHEITGQLLSAAQWSQMAARGTAEYQDVALEYEERRASSGRGARDGAVEDLRRRLDTTEASLDLVLEYVKAIAQVHQVRPPSERTGTGSSTALDKSQTAQPGSGRQGSDRASRTYQRSLSRSRYNQRQRERIKSEFKSRT